MSASMSAAIGRCGWPSCCRRQGREPVDMDDGLGLPPSAFAKLDAEEDELFYEPPRLVVHIDDGAIAALTELYRTVLPAGGVLLELMSSWVSHLPPEIGYSEVLGHGMNAEELAGNPPRRRRFVQNLNRDPH